MKTLFEMLACVMQPYDEATTRREKFLVLLGDVGIVLSVVIVAITSACLLFF